MNSNDVRGGLHRRFTTNALPSLMPIGQQRRQAVGDTQLVSTSSGVQRIKHFQHADSGKGENDDGDRPLSGKRICVLKDATGIGELVAASESSPGLIVNSDHDPKVQEQRSRGHRRGKSCWGAIGDGRPASNSDSEEKIVVLQAENDGSYTIHWLTAGGKPTGFQTRVAPVSTSFHCITAAVAL